MKRCLLIIMVALSGICTSEANEKLCLITIKANGVETNYAISNVQKITFDTQSAESPSFVVNRNDGKQDGGSKLIKFGEAEPSSVEDVSAAPVKVNVYSQGKTIFVEAEEECSIMFFNLAGQRLGDCVKESHCECTISLPGSYIVLAGGQQFKIQMQ